jgi:hypothetical protein
MGDFRKAYNFGLSIPNPASSNKTELAQTMPRIIVASPSVQMISSALMAYLTTELKRRTVGQT